MAKLPWNMFFFCSGRAALFTTNLSDKVMGMTNITAIFRDLESPGEEGVPLGVLVDLGGEPKSTCFFVWRSCGLSVPTNVVDANRASSLKQDTSTAQRPERNGGEPSTLSLSLALSLSLCVIPKCELTCLSTRL